MAIGALLLGLAAPLALVNPLLWCVPAAAVIFSLIALRAINAEGSSLTGRNLALVGLALALVFGLWAPSRHYSRQWRLYSQAHVFADEWLALIHDGKIEQAHQLTLMEVERQRPGTSLAKFYADSQDAKASLAYFRKDKPLKTFIDLGDKATYVFQRGDGIPPPEHARQQVVLAYVARWTEDGALREHPFRIALERQTLLDTNQHLWRVLMVADPHRAEE
jgi:hypothetical protein